MSMPQEELETRFTYHAPVRDQAERYGVLRDTALDFARLIAREVPESRELSLALTHLEQTVMWANAGIARRE